MTYILSRDLPDIESHIYEKRRKERWREYEQRLQRIKKRLSPSVQEFALADWHYNPEDHRCPHDAWLEQLTLRELGSEENVQDRHLEIEIRLLGAYHDGHIELLYRDVESYCFDQPHRKDRWHTTVKGHRDWLVDEVDLSHGNVLHAIEWSDGAYWAIECKSFYYKWIPKE